MNGALIEEKWVRELWDRFVEDQAERPSATPQLVARTMKAVQFFLRIQEEFRTHAGMTGKALCDQLGSKFLRKHLLASRFLLDQLKIDGFNEIRNDVAEGQRALDIVERSADRPYGSLISSYADYLEKRRTNVRTARLYLRATETFCLHSGTGSFTGWPTEALTAFLCESPGHAASLHHFVTYCREQLKWQVAMPPKSEYLAKTSQTIKDKEKLVKHMKTSQHRPLDRQTSARIGRLLALSLGVPLAQLVRERDQGVPRHLPDGSIYLTEAAVIGKGSTLFPYAQRWVGLAERHRQHIEAPVNMLATSKRDEKSRPLGQPSQ